MKKSNAEKAKQGTLQKVRQKEMRPSGLDSGYPIPSAELSGLGLEIYNRICKHLDDVDALYDADTFIITQTAVNLAQMRTIIKDMNEQGLIQYFDNGTRNVSPEFSIFEKCSNLFRQHSRMLGLDPYSRLSMEYFINNGEGASDDPADEFLND